jgi:hypothetical protein
LTSYRQSCRALLTVSAAIASAAIAPAVANAAVSATVSGDDGNPLALGGTLNIRNMSPQVVLSGTASDHWTATITGPNGVPVAPSVTCFQTLANSVTANPDYIGNGTYTVTITNYAANCSTVMSTQTLPFTITASTAITSPPTAQLTRQPGSFVTNTIPLPIDLNPGALATDAFVAINVAANPDGSLPGTPTPLFPDSTTRTVGVPLDKGPGTYVIAARAKGFTGSNGQFFSPWATPAAIRAFDPFDLKSFVWTDASNTRTSPSYRFKATIAATSATGRVNLAIARGMKGKYHSLGTVKIRKHAFSKRFKLKKTGKYRIRFKYKGNSTVAGGFEVRTFQITRHVFFRGATFRSSALR